MPESEADSSTAGLSGRVVILSPHLDDAVLSLGASISRAVHAGARVKVLTVFAGDPHSRRPAGHWDLKSGFLTEGEAAVQRREEDRQACSHIGAETHWLHFSDAQYGQRAAADEIWSTLAPIVAGSDCALLPGYPLLNPDHAWLAEIVLTRGLPCARIGFYAEQPYAFDMCWRRARVSARAQPRRLADDASAWKHPGSDWGDRVAKWHAVRRYGSQLRMLGLTRGRLMWMLLDEATRNNEAIAWPSRQLFGPPGAG